MAPGTTEPSVPGQLRVFVLKLPWMWHVQSVRCSPIFPRQHPNLTARAHLRAISDHLAHCVAIFYAHFIAPYGKLRLSSLTFELKLLQPAHPKLCRSTRCRDPPCRYKCAHLQVVDICDLSRLTYEDVLPVTVTLASQEVHHRTPHHTCTVELILQQALNVRVLDV